MTSTESVEFVVAPPPRQTTTWVKRLAPLRERPGAWAKIRSYATEGSAATMLWAFQSGRVSGVTPTEYNFERRGADLYARYQGPGPGRPGDASDMT